MASCEHAFSKKGFWHTSRNNANRRNRTPPPPGRALGEPGGPPAGGVRGGDLPGEADIGKLREAKA